jgi:hypothetical protein
VDGRGEAGHTPGCRIGRGSAAPHQRDDHLHTAGGARRRNVRQAVVSPPNPRVDARRGRRSDIGVV